MHRSHISIASGTGWSSVVLDDYRGRATTVGSQLRILSHTRTSDGGFQSAVAYVKSPGRRRPGLTNRLESDSLAVVDSVGQENGALVALWIGRQVGRSGHHAERVDGSGGLRLSDSRTK